MVLEQIDPLNDIDWSYDFIWVQRAALLQILAVRDGLYEVRRHDGTTLKLKRSEVQKSYFEIDQGRALKPVYDPSKAYVLKLPASVMIEGKEHRLSPGDALLLHDLRGLSVVPSDEYERDYTAVAYFGTCDKPVRPFPDP